MIDPGTDVDPGGRSASASGSCPCGGPGRPPWRERDAPLSPASVVAGLVVLAFGVLAAVASRQPLVGPVVAAVWLALTVGAGAWCWRAGHRRGCWLGRTTWGGLALLGFPLRVVVGLPF